MKEKRLAFARKHADWLKGQLRNRPCPANLDELKRDISALWVQRTTVDYCRALVKSMSSRCAMVIGSSLMVGT